MRSLHNVSTVKDARAILDHDPYTINSLNEHCCTPLHCAVDVKVAEFLLDHGAFLQAMDDGDYHADTFLGIRDLMVHLKRRPKLDIDFTINGGLTPLHYAVYQDNIPLVSCLLGRGADVTHHRNELEIYPIHLANSIKMFDCLRQHKETDITVITYFSQTILHILAAYTDRDTSPLIRHIVTLRKKYPNSLLGHRGEDAVHGCTPMHYARTRAAASALYEAGANICPLNSRWGTPLHVLAMTAGAGINECERSDADVTSSSNSYSNSNSNSNVSVGCISSSCCTTVPMSSSSSSSLSSHAVSGMELALDDLINFFVTTTTTTATPSSISTDSSSSSSSSDISSSSNVINRPDASGETPLHLAQHSATVRCLVANGARVNPNGFFSSSSASGKDDDGTQVSTVIEGVCGIPPLFMARSAAVCRALVGCGADINECVYRVPAVMYTPHEDVAQYLLRQGARWLMNDALHDTYRAQQQQQQHATVTTTADTTTIITNTAADINSSSSFWLELELPAECRPTLTSVTDEELTELIKIRRNQYITCNNGIVQLALVQYLGREFLEFHRTGKISLHDVYPLQAARGAAVVRLLIDIWCEGEAKGATTTTTTATTPLTNRDGAVMYNAQLFSYVNSDDYADHKSPLHCARNSAVAEGLLTAGALVNLKNAAARCPIHMAPDAATFLTLVRHGAQIMPQEDQIIQWKQSRFYFPLGEFNERNIYVRPHDVCMLWRQLLLLSLLSQKSEGDGDNNNNNSDNAVYTGDVNCCNNPLGLPRHSSYRFSSLQPLVNSSDYTELCEMRLYQELITELRCQIFMKFLCGYGYLPLYCEELIWYDGKKDSDDGSGDRIVNIDVNDHIIVTDDVTDNDSMTRTIMLVLQHESLCCRILEYNR